MEPIAGTWCGDSPQIARCRVLSVTTAGGGAEFDLVSRSFAPSVGVDEDPVCGSAHCMLGPHWWARCHPAAPLPPLPPGRSALFQSAPLDRPPLRVTEKKKKKETRMPRKLLQLNVADAGTQSPLP